MNIDPQTVQATMRALAAVGPTEFYSIVDFARQNYPDADYAQLLADAVVSINEEYADEMV